MRRRVAVFAVVLLVLSGCAGLMQRPESPSVSLVNFTLQDATLFEQRYQLTLRIQNPNDFALPISGMSYRLTINGQEFAQGVSNETVRIPAYGEELVRVPVVSNLARAWQQMMDWADKGTETLDYRLSGKAQLADRALRVPFEYSGELDLRPRQDRRAQR